MEAMIRIRCKGFCAQPKYHNEDEIGIWQHGMIRMAMRTEISRKIRRFRLWIALA